MQCRQKRAKPGEIYPVRGSYQHPLPKGVPDGSLVKLLSFDTGYWKVELLDSNSGPTGEVFEVFMTRLETGFEYEHRGRWLPASHPIIQGHLGK